jgi:hypothetical protein
MDDCDKVPSDAKRFELLVDRPGCAALQFRRSVKVFINRLLGWDDVNRRPAKEVMPGVSSGVFGHTAGYFIAVEEQSRGSLHAHALVWLYGHGQLAQRFQRAVSGATGDAFEFVFNGTVRVPSPAWLVWINRARRLCSSVAFSCCPPPACSPSCHARPATGLMQRQQCPPAPSAIAPVAGRAVSEEVASLLGVCTSKQTESKDMDLTSPVVRVSTAASASASADAPVRPASTTGVDSSAASSSAGGAELAPAARSLAQSLEAYLDMVMNGELFADDASVKEASRCRECGAELRVDLADLQAARSVPVSAGGRGGGVALRAGRECSAAG